MKRAFVAALLCGLCGSVASGQWQPQAIETDADFRGLSAVNPCMAWVSGTKGTFGRTTDGGKTWSVGTVPGADKLDFRDVEAFGEATAYLLSAGPGEDSRIYKTTNGGKTWRLQFQNAEPKAFFDAIAFWDEQHGIALSDPVGGRFVFVVTDDGGATWAPLPEANRPAALPNEGCFAASGTCLVARGENDVWFCTGGAKAARVFHSGDRGTTWSVTETPLLAGIESGGGFSIAFRDRDHGVIVGGDYRKPDGTDATGAVTADGGKTWKLIAKPLPFRSGVAWAEDRWVAVGTSGSDVSLNDGATWQPLDKEKSNSVAFAASGEGWAVGPKGRIAKFAKAAAAPERVKLWNLHAPNGDGTFEKVETWITVHKPEKPNGAAVVICPGGGYGGLVTGAEGHGIAAWLNARGIAGVVLEYRLPKGRPFVPLLDAQRAIRTVRSNAEAWGIDPAKVGIIGFSAGGHLASTAGTHFDDGAPKADDPIEKQSCRPDFLILVYPVITMNETTHGGSRTNLLGKQPDVELVKLFSNETQVTPKTPPAFLAHAKDDKVVVPANSKAFYDALLAQKVPAKYLELASGGHGLNGYKGPMWDAWQTQSLAWLGELKFVPAVAEKP